MEFIGPYGMPSGSPWVQGDAAANIKGSYIDFHAFTDAMHEIVHVIETAGLTPDGDNLTQLYLAIEALIDAKVGTNGVGEYHFRAVNDVPSKEVIANGALLSRSVFPELFAKIGTTFGAGDGATTFAIPDMRGVFPRGLDLGRGLDPGRALATLQAHMIAKHRHIDGQVLMQGAVSLWGGESTLSTPSGFYVGPNTTSNTKVPWTDDGSGHLAPPAGTVTGTPNAAGLIGAETRPVNMAAVITIQFA